jgi:hypothetical protein
LEKSNNDVWNSKRVKVESEPTVQLRETVRMVLLQPIRLKINGAVTGTRYFWNGAGSVIEVDKKDVEELLKKNTKPCLTCSGTLAGTPYFEIVR